jgi:kynurenine aminotransferase
VPFTRIANLSPEVEKLTLTVGSAGKNFYATGWRVGTFSLFCLEGIFRAYSLQAG